MSCEKGLAFISNLKLRYVKEKIVKQLCNFQVCKSISYSRVIMGRGVEKMLLPSFGVRIGGV